MPLKKSTKWKRINEKVMKHLALLEIEDKKTNSVEEPMRTKYSKESLNSDLLEYCQQLNENETLGDELLINEEKSINSNCSDNELDSSCSSVEYCLFEDDFNEESTNDNSSTGFPINNTFNVLTNSTKKTYRNLESDLAQWAVEYRVSHATLNSLLRILQEYNCNVCSDARTLLKTPKNTSVLEMHGGQYCYFGIANSLKTLFSKVPKLKWLQEINLFTNIDGLPLANSSSIQFWPIPCKINQSFCNLDPFIAAVYCGQSKPPDLHDYLKDFIQEYKNLSDNGLVIDTKLYSVTISGFICDAPARAFVKGHNGFYGCERCTQKGTHPFGATIFNEVDAEIRTD